MKIAILTSIFAGMAIIISVILRRRSGPQIGEIAPSSVLQKKYGLYAESRRPIHINPAEVPENIRDLIPLAEKWGISDDIIRTDFENKTSAIEQDEFKRLMDGRTAEVDAWLSTFRGPTPMTDAAVHFMYMLAALDEIGAWPNPAIDDSKK